MCIRDRFFFFFSKLNAGQIFIVVKNIEGKVGSIHFALYDDPDFFPENEGKKIGFKNILISDDLSMKSLKDDLKTNTIKTFSAGCNLALHCNGKLSEMKVVGDNSPKVSNFIIKKTSLFYKILS